MTSTSVNERTRRVSRITLWAMMAVAAVTWLLFLTVGYNRTSADDPRFTAPLLTDVVILVVILFLLMAMAALCWAVVCGVRRVETETRVMHGVPTARIALITAGGTLLLLLATFVLSSSSPILINGAEYDNAFWLRCAGMFVVTVGVMLLIALGAVAFNAWRTQRLNDMPS